MSLEHAQALLRLLDSPPTGALPADAQASSLLLLAPWAAPDASPLPGMRLNTFPAYSRPY